MATITAGMRINEYVMDERIGGGAFGEVWRAFHHVWTDQVVAFKIPTNADYVRNLQREGAVIHGLQHPNIVRATGFDPYHDPPYLMMEYVPGTSLRPLIQQGKLTPQDAVNILRQVLAGLAEAHKKGVIHRDVKPENILIDQRAMKEGFAVVGVVKIADFGLGRAAAQTMMGSIQISRDVSQDGRLVGTLDYMAPEQRKGAEIDSRADLYACGVLMYEMITGELPEGFELPSAHNSKAPVYLDEVFKRAYATLEKRFATAAEFAEALNPSGNSAGAAGGAAIGASGRPALDQEPIAAGGIPAHFTNSLGMKFIRIDPGTFVIGSPHDEEGRDEDEMRRQVTLHRSYLLGAGHVTRGQFAAFVADTEYETDAEREGWAFVWRDGKWAKAYGASWRNPGFLQDDDHPVVEVSWYDAAAFAQWLSDLEGKPYRLPNEAEWEYACRAGTTTSFYTGSTINTHQANFDGNFIYGNGVKGIYRQATTAIESFPPNPWGLHDMHGNAWQWCEDIYVDDEKNDARSRMELRKEPNPLRVMRGGSWFDSPAHCRSAVRGFNTTDFRNDNIGFRLVLDSR